MRRKKGAETALPIWLLFSDVKQTTVSIVISNVFGLQNKEAMNYFSPLCLFLSFLMIAVSTLFLMPNVSHLLSLLKSLWEWQISAVEVTNLIITFICSKSFAARYSETLMNESQQRGRSDCTIFSRRLFPLFPLLSLSLSFCSWRNCWWMQWSRESRDHSSHCSEWAG